MLAEMRARTSSAMAQHRIEAAPGMEQPRLIDEKMYQASLETRKKQSEKLSESNAYIGFLEARLAECYDDLMLANNFMKTVSMEFGATSRMSESLNSTLKFGVDKEEAAGKLLKLSDRLALLEKAVQTSREEFGVRVPQEVPIRWVGVANEVRLQGDFDDWTRGIELNVSEIDVDGSLRSFEGTVRLLPGKYRVK